MRNVISASVESIITDRPKFFVEEGFYGVAIFGALMPYNVYLSLVLCKLHGLSMAFNEKCNDGEVINLLYKLSNKPSDFADHWHECASKAVNFTI